MIKIDLEPRLAAGPVALALALGCGDPRDTGNSPNATGTPLVTTADTAGTQIRVVNSGDPPAWDLAVVASIGPGPELAEATPGDFGEAVSVAFGPDENTVYVADRQNCEVRVFGIDGTHQRTFGRCGEGPGEFTEALWSIAWVGDKLLAFDFGGGRIGEIAADGEWLGQREIIGVPRGSWRQALYPVGGGEAYAYALAAEPGSSGRLGLAWYGHDAAGETADTVFPPAESVGSSVVCTWQGGGSFTVEFFNNPYAPRSVVHPGRGGTLFSAVSDEYRIAVARGDDTLRTVARELAPEPLPTTSGTISPVSSTRGWTTSGPTGTAIRTVRSGRPPSRSSKASSSTRRGACGSKWHGRPATAGKCSTPTADCWPSFPPANARGPHFPRSASVTSRRSAKTAWSWTTWTSGGSIGAAEHGAAAPSRCLGG